MAYVCRICGNRLEPKENVVTVNCGHVFHRMCLESHFKRATKCPTCLTPCVATAVQPIHLSVCNAAPPVDAVALRQQVALMQRRVRQRDTQVAKLRELAIGFEKAQEKSQTLERDCDEMKRKLQVATIRNQYKIEHLKKVREEERAKRKQAEADLAAARKKIRLLRMQVGYEPDMVDDTTQTDDDSASPVSRRPLSDSTNSRSAYSPAPGLSQGFVERFLILRGPTRLENGTTKPPPGRVYDGLGGTMREPLKPSTPRRIR